ICLFEKMTHGKHEVSIFVRVVEILSSRKQRSTRNRSPLLGKRSNNFLIENRDRKNHLRRLSVDIFFRYEHRHGFGVKRISLCLEIFPKVLLRGIGVSDPSLDIA